MRSIYKKLGSYIREVDIRNTEDRKENLLGVSTQKCFIESIANTVGTNFKRYKIVRKGQFTYVPDTSRRGDKIGIALLDSHNQALVSNVYTVFEIIDHNKLLPEYLMMWFRRPEFDRYTRYMSHGSVRELFGWEELCDVELPIPSIEKQREIVKEYRTVVDRIKLNEQINQKLEETAQAIYKHWFVDFEFPISKEYAKKVGRPELEGKPYKSSGGKMVWNVELEKEIPEGWEVDKLGNLTDTVDNRGKTPPHTNNSGDFPLIEIASLKTSGRIPSLGNCSKFLSEQIYNSWFRNGHPHQKDVLFSTVGSLAELKIFWNTTGSIAQNIVGFRTKDDMGLYLYQYLRNSIDELLSYEIGSVQASIKVSQVIDFKVMLPYSEILNMFERISEILTNAIYLKSMESDLFEKTLEILLIKMTKAGV